MPPLKRLLARIAAFFGGRALDRDFDEELASHLAMQIDENIARGMTPDEARRAARIRFGGEQSIKQQHREARGLPAVNSIWFHAQGVARPVTSPFARVLSNAAATRGLALAAQVAAGAPPRTFAELRVNDAAQAANASAATLVELDPFSVPYITQDWMNWNAATFLKRSTALAASACR